MLISIRLNEARCNQLVLPVDTAAVMQRVDQVNMRNQAGGCTFELNVLFVLRIYHTPVGYDTQATLRRDIVDNPLFNNLIATKLLALQQTREASDSASNNYL